MVDNSKAFGNGMAKAKAAIIKQLKPIYSAIARDLLYDAVKLWEGNTSQESADAGYVADGVNMTGNTINSYMAGVYWKGSLFDIIYSYDVGVTDRPTAGYSYPGDMIYTWHQASMSINPSGGVSTVENSGINHIQPYKSKKYSFQQVGRGNGIDDARKFLQSHKTSYPLEVAVVVGVPYADYLESVRKLDVLKENSEASNVRKMADANFASVKPLEI